jgi:glycosyltransferase involved in cell wall biosynthesis
VIRVCYVVDAAFLGGAERYVARLAMGLDRRRFEPALLMAETDDAALDAWSRELADAGVAVRRARMRLPFRPGDAVGILGALEATGATIVHVNMPGPYNGQCALMVPLARLTGARVVVTEHLPMVPPLWKRAALKRVAYRWLDAAITVSEANAAFLTGPQRVPPSRARVVYNGVPTSYGKGAPPAAVTRARLGIPAGDVVVAFVGNIIEHKGLRDLIEALSRCADAPWTLVVVGAGPDEARARSLARGLGVASRVRFAGRLSTGEVEAALVASDVLALPSRMEGMPYVILEAMACARPVVATRVYGIPEAVVDGETGSLVDPGDTAALVRALEPLLRSGELRRRLGEGGRRRFEALFTLERHVATMEALYAELAAAGRRRR